MIIVLLFNINIAQLLWRKCGNGWIDSHSYIYIFHCLTWKDGGCRWVADAEVGVIVSSILSLSGRRRTLSSSGRLGKIIDVIQISLYKLLYTFYLIWKEIEAGVAIWKMIIFLEGIRFSIIYFLVLTVHSWFYLSISLI